VLVDTITFHSRVHSQHTDIKPYDYFNIITHFISVDRELRQFEDTIRLKTCCFGRYLHIFVKRIKHYDHTVLILSYLYLYLWSGSFPPFCEVLYGYHVNSFRSNLVIPVSVIAGRV
jgi:hypothetical protein